MDIARLQIVLDAQRAQQQTRELEASFAKAGTAADIAGRQAQGAMLKLVPPTTTAINQTRLLQAQAVAATSAFQQLGNAAQQAGGKIQNSFRNIGGSGGGGNVGGILGALGLGRLSTVGAGGALGAAGAVGLVGYGIKDALETTQSLDRIRSLLNVATGDIKAGASEFDFVREKTKELGIAFEDTARAYAKMLVPLQTGGSTTEQSRQVFGDLAVSVRNLGLTAEQTSSVFLAFEQMLSKGTVQSQELKLQLGNSLPGALIFAAKAAGVTKEEFNKLLETGKIISSDFVPKMAAVMREFSSGTARINELTLATNRFAQAWQELKDRAGTAMTPAASGVVNFATSLANHINEGLAIFNAGGAGGFIAKGIREQLEEQERSRQQRLKAERDKANAPLLGLDDFNRLKQQFNVESLRGTRAGIVAQFDLRKQKIDDEAMAPTLKDSLKGMLNNMMSTAIAELENSIQANRLEFRAGVTGISNQRLTGTARARADARLQADVEGNAIQDAWAKSELPIQKLDEALGELEKTYNDKLAHIPDTWAKSWNIAVEQFGTASDRFASMGAALADSIDTNLSESLTEAVFNADKAGEAFTAFGRKVAEEMTRIAIQQLVVRNIMQGLGSIGSLFGSAAGSVSAVPTAGATGLPSMHGGGVVRRHSGGMGGDEIPIIARRNEVVFTPEQLKAMRGTTKAEPQKVQIYNSVDDTAMAEYLLKNPDVIVNVIGRRKNVVRQILQ